MFTFPVWLIVTLLSPYTATELFPAVIFPDKFNIPFFLYIASPSSPVAIPPEDVTVPFSEYIPKDLAPVVIVPECTTFPALGA